MLIFKLIELYIIFLENFVLISNFPCGRFPLVLVSDLFAVSILKVQVLSKIETKQ